MPLRIDTLEVKNTLVAFANGKNSDKHKKVVKNHITSSATTWTGLQYFWTSGLRIENLTRRFQWCLSANSSTEISTDFVTWKSGQPDNLGGRQDCLHLRILTDKSQTLASDHNCTSKFPFACQVLQNCQQKHNTELQWPLKYINWLILASFHTVMLKVNLI